MRFTSLASGILDTCPYHRHVHPVGPYAFGLPKDTRISNMLRLSDVHYLLFEEILNFSSPCVELLLTDSPTYGNRVEKFNCILVLQLPKSIFFLWNRSLNF